MKLTIVVETNDKAFDPKDTDPHIVAEAMIDEYNAWVSVNGAHHEAVQFISAEWTP